MQYGHDILCNSLLFENNVSCKFGFYLFDLEEATESVDIIEKTIKNNTRIVLRNLLLITVDSVSAFTLAQYWQEK